MAYEVRIKCGTKEEAKEIGITIIENEKFPRVVAFSIIRNKLTKDKE